MRKVDSPGADLTAVRTLLEGNAAEIHRERHERAAKSDALARLQADLETRRAAYVADLNVAGRYDAAPGADSLSYIDRDILAGEPIDLLLYLFPKEIEARLTAEIEAAYEERPGGCTATERGRKLSALARERLDLLRREEELVRAAESAGVVVERRGDAPPALVVARDLSLVTVADIEPC